MKKTIRIIDLLNKIAKGEEVPKKIKYKDIEFDYFEGSPVKYHANFLGVQSQPLCNYYDDNNLNDEVEIIEEDKKIEELDISDRKKRVDCYPLTVEIMAKINELVRAINELKKGE